MSRKRTKSREGAGNLLKPRREQPPPQPPLEGSRLTQELQVHQEEMEIQNRQLVESQRLLEESRDRYDNLYDFAPVAHVSFSPKGVIREINLTGAALLGQSRDRLVDRPFVLFVAAPYRRPFLSHLSRCRAGATPSVTCTLAISRSDGSTVPIELRSNCEPIDSTAGPVYLSVLLDLSERRHAEQERKRLNEAMRSERLLRTTLEALPVAVRVLDAEARPLIHNQAVYSLWAIPSDMLMPSEDEFKGWNADTHQRLTPGAWPVSQVLAEGKPVIRQKVHIQDFKGQVKIVLQSAVPLLDEGGAVSGAVEVSEDATPLLTAQESAHRRQEQLEAAFDAAHLSFWDWDLETSRVTWSGPFEEVFSSAPDNSTGRGIDFLRRVHPDDVAAVEKAVAEARSGHSPLEMEFRVVLPDGNTQWLAAKGRFAYSHRRAVRMTGVVIDITARKSVEEEVIRAKERAEEASRLKDEFLATVSHELRTPLSAILLWGHLAQTTQREAERIEALETILNSARAQSQLVDDLLDISRSIAGKLRLNLASTSLTPAVRAAVDSMRPLAESRQVTLTAHLADDLPLVLIDPDRIRQIATNLLTNALKFTPPGGSVTVNLGVNGSTHEQQTIRLSVADTGQGIKPEFLPHVFDRFRQGEATLTRTHGGLGLGLAISRELVLMHGGSIRAESHGLGSGATFTVELPAHIALLSASAPPKANGSRHEDLKGVHVLLVEDDTDQRVAIDRVLKSAGAIVQSTDSASAALKAFQETPPDVLVSDIAMPDEDGYSLLRNIRKVETERIVKNRRRTPCASAPGNGHTPALALTAHARPEDRAKAAEAGYEAHLAKPVEPARLVSAVADLCHRHTAPAALPRRPRQKPNHL